MPTSILFSFHPFANIWSAVLKLHPIRFAIHEKAHYVAIDHNNVFQIQNDAAAVRLEFKKSPQLGYRRCFDSAAQDEYRESPRAALSILKVIGRATRSRHCAAFVLSEH